MEAPPRSTPRRPRLKRVGAMAPTMQPTTLSDIAGQAVQSPPPIRIIMPQQMPEEEAEGNQSYFAPPSAPDDSQPPPIPLHRRDSQRATGPHAPVPAPLLPERSFRNSNVMSRTQNMRARWSHPKESQSMRNSTNSSPMIQPTVRHHTAGRKASATKHQK